MRRTHPILATLMALGSPITYAASPAQAEEARMVVTGALDIASDGTMTVMVPVSFSTRAALGEYGHWETYFPGAHHPAPWLSQPEPDRFRNPGALAANGIYPVKRSGPQLLTTPDPD
ncbi:MAG TPA: hypothetical protein VGH80_15355 [Xanthomonadaceae bacterium]|jgi:hypothetical protein